MDNELSSIFIRWSLLDWWDTLILAYKEKGFTDELTDKERIEEFTKITNLMNKWITKAEAAVKPHWPFNKDKGIEALSNMSDKIALTERYSLVYAKLRNNWTEMAIDKITMMIINEAQMWAEEDEGSDLDGREHYQF